MRQLWKTLLPGLGLLAGVTLGWVGFATWEKPAPGGPAREFATFAQGKEAPEARAPATPPRLAWVDALPAHPGPRDPAPAGTAGPFPETSEGGALPLPGTAAPAMPAGKPRPNPPLRRRVRAGEPAATPGPRLAIVIDDLGHSLGRPRRFLALGVPLTFSVLPGLRYSGPTAALIREAGREFLIHLPMEPLDFPRQNPGPQPLLLAQDEGFTRRRMEGFLGAFPQAIGASNHMGSAYSFDARKMAIVQGLIGRRGLLFLNSRTSASPVPGLIAAREGYRFLERDVFLDNVRQDGAVAAQLERALGIARKKGQAVAIGHPYPQTYRALQKALSRWGRAGVRLVPLSELARPWQAGD